MEQVVLDGTFGGAKILGSDYYLQRRLADFFQTRLLFEEIHQPCFPAEVFGILCGESFSAKISKSSESRLVRKFIILLCGAEKQNPQS